MSDIDRDTGAEIVRFPAGSNAPAPQRQPAAGLPGLRQRPDPTYWRDKALGFRHAALTSATTDLAAMLLRRAAEFERMAAVMESEEGRPAAPPIAATAEKRLQSVVDIVRDTAEQLRDKIAELPMPPAPPAMAFVTAAVPARQPIARRAQRLVFPPPPPAGPIARRAHRLTRD